MENTIVDIQKLINDRADARLDKAVEALNSFVRNHENHPLLEDIRLNIGTADKPNVIYLYNIFNSTGLRDKIIEANKERYRKEESSIFLAKVESLREDVDNLMNGSHDY